MLIIMNKSNLKYNIVLSLLLALLFVLLETFFRFQYDALVNTLKVNDYFGIVLVFFYFLLFPLHSLKLPLVFYQYYLYLK